MNTAQLLWEMENPGIQELLKLAIIAKISEKKAHFIIAQVKNAVSQWKKFAKIAHVSTQSIKNIEKFIQKTL